MLNSAHSETQTSHCGNKKKKHTVFLSGWWFNPLNIIGRNKERKVIKHSWCPSFVSIPRVSCFFFFPFSSAFYSHLYSARCPPASLAPQVPHVPSPVYLIVKVLVSIMLKCVSLQQKPPSDMESDLTEDYTADENEWINVFLCRREQLFLNLLFALGFSPLSILETKPSLLLASLLLLSNYVNSHLNSNSNFIPGIKKTNFTTLIAAT